MTSVNPAETSLVSSQSKFRTSQLATTSTPPKVAPSKLATGKTNPSITKRLEGLQNSEDTTHITPEENFDVVVAENTTTDTPVDSTVSIDKSKPDAMVPQPDEQISSMPAASLGVSGTTWGVLAGGLGLAAAGGGGGGGGQSAPAPKLTIDKIATDDVMGPTEKDTAIQGATLAGATVQIKIGDRTRAATVTGTSWRYLITAEDIAAMGQGDETITVVASLADGTTVTLTRSIKVFTLDGIVDIGISSAEGIQNDTLNAKDVVFITVKMSEVYTVTGKPQLNINIDGKAAVANYVSGSGSASLVFSYTIVDGQNDTKGISIEAGALMLNGGTMLNATGKSPDSFSYGGVNNNTKYLVDTLAPTLSNVTYQMVENTKDVADLKGADASAITYSLAGTSGDDSGLFLLTEGGVLTLKAPANFESIGNASTDHSYKLGVNMTDLAGNVSHQTLTVQITNVNEAPVITSAANASFAENGTGMAYQAMAKDEDVGSVLSYSISGTDAALFNVDAKTGAVTYKMSPNFESSDDAGADNVYNFTLKVSDGTLTTAQDVAITVTNVVDTNFKLNFLSDFSNEAQTGFKKAANFWSSVLSDDVLINLDLDYTSANFNANTIGSTFTSRVDKTYVDFRKALVADAVSDADKTAAASLSQTDTFGMLINHTPNNPFGINSATPYLDNNGNSNNASVFIARANAKALGLVSANDLAANDAKIAFNSAFNFDFDRTDGITVGKIDFVGTAIHEIGHALGFSSGVDYLDQFATDLYPETQYTVVTPLDFFRYSKASTQSGVIDWTASATDKYFSLDNGATKIASFSTGFHYGDGYQNSHWKDGQGLGGLDPSLSAGELLYYSSLDQLGFDVIGWNLSDSLDNFAAPQITSLTAVSYFNKGTTAAYTVVATDADSWNRLSFSISGGADASKFSINALTGVVKFIAAPDYAKPADADANNIYKFNVTARDSVHTSSEVAVSINVLQTTQNLNETLAGTANLNAMNNYGPYYVL